MKTLSDESSEPLLLSYASPSTIPAATPSILFNVNLTPHQARPPPPLHKPPSLTIPKCKSPTSSLPLTDEKPKTTFSIVDRHLRRRSSSLLPQSTTSASTTISSKRHPLLLSHASNHEQAAISGSTSICTSQHGREEAMNKMRLFQPLPHNVAKPQKGYFNETSTSLTAKNGNNIYDSSFSYSNRISPNYYFHYFCYNNETITNILDVKPSILGPRPSILGPCPSSIDTDFTIFNTRLSILGPRRSILGPHPFTFSRENCNYFHPKLTNKKRKSQPSVDFSKKSCTPVDSLPFSRINCPSFNRVKRDREEGIFMFSSVSERPLKKLKSFSKVFKFVVEDDHSQDLYLQKSKMKTKDVIISPPRRVKRARDVDIYCFTTVKLFVKRRKFIDEDQEEIGEEQNPKEFELIIRQKGIDKKDDTGLELEDKHVGNIKIRETQEQTSGNDRKGNENRDVNLEEPHCSDWIDQNSDFEDAVCDFDNSNWDYQDSDFEDAIGDPSSFEQWETTVDTKIMTILQREVTPTYNNYQDLEYHREDADCMDWNYLQRITNGSQESCSPGMETESTIGGTPTFELLSQETKDKMEKTLEKKVGTKKGEKKKFTRKFYNRCYPNVLVQYFEQMKKDKEIDKMNKLKSLGFFAMTQLKITKTHNKFITWVCENFISSQLKIRLEGDITMSISENDVHRVYKLPRGPRRIDRCSKEEMDALKKELGFKIGSKRSENLHLIDIQSRLPSYKNDETWQKAILLLSIGYVLCPSKNLTVSLKYARCLSKLDEVCEYNWCEHLLQHLQRNIQPGTLYPNGDIQFLMVHVMDILKQGDLSTSEPTCMKWSNEQLFHCFDKLAKGDGFGKAIAKKSTRKVEGCNHMHSDYSVGVGNAAQMPSARSCNSLEQCHQYMDYRKYNISAWTNCLKDLEKNEKELLKDASGQADTVGSRLKKRKKSLTTNDAEEEKFTKKPDRDMEELDQLLNDCEILQDKICNQDDEREKKKMVVVFVNDSQDSCEGKGRPKRETKESKFKRTPFREKIKITLPPFDENEKELLSYAFDKGKNHHEVLFQMNMEKRFNLDREAILTLENKNFIVSAIIDHCTRAMNVYNLKKGECKRLSLTIAATTSMTTTTKKEKFLDKRTEEECIAWFVKTIESSPFWSLDDFKSEYLQYVFFPIYFQSHFTVFVVDLKEGKGQYLNSLAEVQMSNVVKDAANCVARSLFCFLKKAGVGNFEDWNGSWEIAPVPQQTPRSNACGWFVVKFIEEWNGEPASMATFRGWSNLDNTQRNKIITHGRQQICLSILKSEYNDIDFKDLQMKKKRTTESLRMEVQQEKKKRQSLRIQLEQEKK